MRKKGIVCGFLMTLLAGIILGASGGFLIFPKLLPPPPPSGEQGREKGGGAPPPSPTELGEKIMNRLEMELNLTAAQKIQVEKEVKDFSEELNVFHTGNRDKLSSMFETFKTKLAALLSKEQVTRLNNISRGICNTAPPPPDHRQMRDQEDRRPPKND